ncbi:hypothetical protein FD51_GL001516 [Lacticaseibacillus zeae DSM 20178 = KCTC 3804]|uniref:Uncharacterized protein n=1 Tax=Lacticaseibacillus zeae DSM 20178 = KCTC 3804 TaxID=1423816 RepID=A0A0R1EWG2_LACZE|nr:hypothetical protein FD51_GL001516 [Lacticaseibacillus zeae DSM 20178 = KCTC 3804]
MERHGFKRYLTFFSIAMFVFAFGKYRFNSIPHHDDIVVYFRVQVYDKSKFL